MILSLMRFAGYSWKHNPVELKIENKKIKDSSVFPYFGEVNREGLKACSVISGKGELLGEDCIEQYKKLLELYDKGTQGVLSIPGIMPLYAVFSGVSAVGETTPDLISYTFEFTEVSAEKKPRKKEYHIVSAGETLYDIAYAEGVSLEALIALNAQLVRPDTLHEGERVRLC